MNMKRTITSLAIIAALALCHGCYRDLGNYDYVELDKVVIDTAGTGTLASYAVYRYDTLRISPNVLYNDELVNPDNPQFANLDFTWSIFQATVGGTVYSRDTLSKSVHLEAPVTRPSGSWIVHLSVKNTDTGVETYFRTAVQVDETVSDGWLVLYETEDGNTDVGLIVDDYVKNGAQKERVFTGLFAGTNGRPLKGRPTAVCHSAACIGSGEILIGSENELLAVDKISFEPTFPFESLFWEAPGKQAPTAIISNVFRKELVINDNHIHTSNFMTSGITRTNYFGEASFGSHGRLAPWAAQFAANCFDAVVYDQEAGRFLQLPYGDVTVAGFAEQDMSLCAFDVNNVGMEMIASDYGRNYTEFSLMKDASGYALLASDFMNTDQTSTGIGVGRYDLTGFPEIEKACTLVGTLNGEYVYYGGGSGLYIFKYNSGNPAYRVWKAPDGEVVTCAGIMKMTHTQIYETLMPNPCQLVFIATYSENERTGKVYEYLIDPANGELVTSSERVRSGFGRITAMCYKWSF